MMISSSPRLLTSYILSYPLLRSSTSTLLFTKMAATNASGHLARDVGKIEAAKAAVNAHLKNKMAVGIGSGSTMVFVAQEIAKVVKMDKLDIKCVPTSYQAKELIRANGLILSDLEEVAKLDVAFDGADEVDAAGNLIKGGGGCHTQEKIVAASSDKLVIICDNTKKSVKLGQKWKKGIPIEVVPSPLQSGPHFIIRKIQNDLRGKVVFRTSSGKMGPVFSDNGNIILDWIFNEDEDYDWLKVDQTLKMIPGVIETGLFIGMTHEVFFGSESGEVSRFLVK